MKIFLVFVLPISIAILQFPRNFKDYLQRIGVKWSNRNYLELLTGFECKEKIG
ncbi:hypothetical protein [Methanosarcina barkeri]|uniref:hypothetical protein n=1 Tax=Methanosarcina barkeri TaxID=2208 RepID=UPI000A732777|nr:hypothetical protein [Methanosarcina barkeri]